MQREWIEAAYPSGKLVRVDAGLVNENTVIPKNVAAFGWVFAHPLLWAGQRPNPRYRRHLRVAKY